MIRRQEDNVEQEKGAILVLTAFAMILLLGIAALVVDIVILQQARIRAQATADSAALAAVQDLNVVPDATAAAQEYALRNYNVAITDWAGCTDSGALAESTGVDCISVDTASSLKLIRVRLPDRRVSTFFAPLLGIDEFSVSATATAEVEYVGGSPGIPTTGDADPADFQEVADFVRAGDPGEGFDKCPDRAFLPVGPGNTYTDDQGKGAKWGEYIFVFEHLDGHTQTVCGTSSDAIIDPSGTTWQWGMDTWVKDTGGPPSAPGNIDGPHPAPGMPVHVSCSQNFIALGGWDGDSKGNGPIQGVDTDWRIIRYYGARYQVSKGAKPADPGKGKPATPPTGEIYIKNACGFSFPSITSDPTPATPEIRLSD